MVTEVPTGIDQISCSLASRNIHANGTNSVCIQGINSSTSGNSSENLASVQRFSNDLWPISHRKPVQNSQVASGKKRKRSRASKNSDEIESQRMIHIAVERNRRKQMNEHLSILRSLMPGFYVQRGDQASIIGGAIEFVKELEVVLESLQAQKHVMISGHDIITPQLDDVFSDLQATPSNDKLSYTSESFTEPFEELMAESSSTVADVVVKISGSDALVKVLSHKSSGQLLKVITAIESLHLAIMQLHITTREQNVLYRLNLKVGVESHLHTPVDLANSIQEVFCMIHGKTWE